MLYGMLAKLLMSGKLKFTPGRIDIFGDSYAMIPMISLAQLTQDAERKGKPEVQDLYIYGWEFGYVITRHIVNYFKLKTFDEKYRVVMDFTSVVGFGDYKTSSFKPGDARFKVFKNPFAMELYPTDHPVDHYMRGMNAGGGSLVHDMLINGIELECTAQNGDHCSFVNANRPTWESLDQEKVQAQLDVDYCLSRQEEIVESCGDSMDRFKVI